MSHPAVRELRRPSLAAFIVFVMTLSVAFGVQPLGAQEILVTNVFDGADILGVLRDVSAQTGVNIIPDYTVEGWVTLELNEVPLEKALEMILAPGGYTFVKIGDYYLVGSAASDNPTFALLSNTEVVKLKYVKAENAARLLSDHFTPYVKVGTTDNVLVITGSRAMIQRIKEDLAQIDRPIPQVLMEVLVVEVSSDTGKSFKTDWRYQGSRGESDPAIPLSGFVDFVGGIWGGKLTIQGGLESVVASMRLLVDDGKAEIHATPRLAALDGESAEIFLGRDQYLVIDTSTDSTTSTRLETIRTGISLKFTPRISDNGEILIKIQPEVSDAVAVSGGLPQVNRRSVSTTLRVKDGETIVIGGLNLKSEHEVKSKVPLLGDLPVVGLLFSSTKKAATETETVIFITPKIL
ncbi:MAG: hypothetical protein NUW23_07610 [Firmicutes bacterium]|jgi:type II secretory pathway component GspD/PulD (secretin)|nr:hypothetical protein [Bacillota bacterium]